MLIVFKFLKKFLPLEAAIIITAFYTAFTGCEPASLRALIMIINFQFSKRVRRNYDFLSSLCLSALLILIFKPYYIVNIAFTLSFLATLGIKLFYKKLTKVFYRLPKRLNESLSIGLSVQSLVMPYSLFTLKTLTFAFVFGNLFLIPIYTGIIILGIISLPFIYLPLVFNFICNLIWILYIGAIGASGLLEKLSLPIFYVTSYDAYIIFALYLVYILFKLGYKKTAYLIPMLFILAMVQFYSFIPSVSYVCLKGGEGVIVRNKFKSVLISNVNLKDQAEKDKILKIINVNSFIYAAKGVKLSLNDNYFVSFQEHCLKVENNTKQILMADKNEAMFNGLGYSKNYDIMYFDNKNNQYPFEEGYFCIIKDKIIGIKE
jgi:competence protein ComEC